jgi:Tol biopolymer transport system component
MRFFLIDRDGRQLSDMTYAYYDPVWSPTEDVLAYQGGFSVQERLFIIDADGVPLAVSEPLAPRTCMACSTLPRWAPDGNKVALITKIGETPLTVSDIVLCIAHVDGTVFHMSLLTYLSNIEQLVWLDNSHLLMQAWKGERYSEEHYLLFDNEAKTVQEITSSFELTSTLGLDGSRD